MYAFCVLYDAPPLQRLLATPLRYIVGFENFSYKVPTYLKNNLSILWKTNVVRKLNHL